MLTIIYFLNMGQTYINTIKINLSVKFLKFNCMMYILALFILIAYFQNDIFYVVSVVIYLFNGSDMAILDKTIYGLPNRILIYLGKVVPLMVASVVHIIISFLAF